MPDKTMLILTSKNLIRFKLIVDNQLIEQVMQFNYLGSHMIGNKTN